MALVDVKWGEKQILLSSITARKRSFCNGWFSSKYAGCECDNNLEQRRTTRLLTLNFICQVFAQLDTLARSSCTACLSCGI